MKETKPGQSVQRQKTPNIDDTLKQLEGRPDLLAPIHLRCIGQWYINKYPTPTLFHSNQTYAKDLLKIRKGEPIFLWERLATLLACLSVYGQLSSKILEVYNSAFKKYGKVITYFESILKTSGDLANELRANISKCKNSILKDIETPEKPLSRDLFKIEEEIAYTGPL